MRLAYNRPPEGYNMAGKAKHGQCVGEGYGFKIWIKGDVYMLTHERATATFGPFFNAKALWSWIMDTQASINSREVN